MIGTKIYTNARFTKNSVIKNLQFISLQQFHEDYGPSVCPCALSQLRGLQNLKRCIKKVIYRMK